MLRVKDIMTKMVITVNGSAKVQDLCKMLIKNRLSGLPVVDNKHKLIGFVSERDVIASVDAKDFLKKRAKDIMTKRVLFLTEEMTSEQVSRIFTEKPYRYLPVLREGKVIGIVSRKDVIDRLLGQYY